MKLFEKLFGKQNQVKSENKSENKFEPKKEALHKLTDLDYDYLKQNGHSQNIFISNKYSIESKIPTIDYSNWIINKLKIKDYESIWKLLVELYISSGFTLKEDRQIEMNSKKKFIAFIDTDFKGFINSDEILYYELVSVFLITQMYEKQNNGFNIAEDKKSEYLARLLGFYSFSLNEEKLEILIKRTNAFIKKIKKESEGLTDYWDNWKLYNKKDFSLNNINPCNEDFKEKIKELNISEKFLIYDLFKRKYVFSLKEGISYYQSRQFGLNEFNAIEKLEKFGFFTNIDSFDSISDVLKKSDLVEFFTTKGIDIKKSWTAKKIIQNIQKLDNGSELIQDLINQFQIVELENSIKEEITKLIEYKNSVRNIAEVLCLI